MNCVNHYAAISETPIGAAPFKLTVRVAYGTICWVHKDPVPVGQTCHLARCLPSS